MTRPKMSRYTVNSFGPELMAVLLKGARERVEIPCPDQRTMKFIQMRLQMLRGAMYRERHPQYDLVTRARTSRTWQKGDSDKNCVLVVAPNDSQFSDIFRRAGIVPTEHERDILENIDSGQQAADTAPPTSDPNPYDKWKKLI
jgi:hypothetical protein